MPHDLHGREIRVGDRVRRAAQVAPCEMMVVSIIPDEEKCNVQCVHLVVGMGTDGKAWDGAERRGDTFVFLVPSWQCSRELINASGVGRDQLKVVPRGGRGKVSGQ